MNRSRSFPAIFFEIRNEEDVEDLSVEMITVIKVSFQGYESIQPIREYVGETKFIEILKIIGKYTDELGKLEDDMKDDLRAFVDEGIKIDLDGLSDWFRQVIYRAFLDESKLVR